MICCTRNNAKWAYARGKKVVWLSQRMPLLRATTWQLRTLVRALSGAGHRWLASLGMEKREHADVIINSRMTKAIILAVMCAVGMRAGTKCDIQVRNPERAIHSIKWAYNCSFTCMFIGGQSHHISVSTGYKHSSYTCQPLGVAWSWNMAAFTISQMDTKGTGKAVQIILTSISWISCTSVYTTLYTIKAAHYRV